MKDKDGGEEGKSARQGWRGRRGWGGEVWRGRGQKARRPTGEAGGAKEVRSPPRVAAPPGPPRLLRAETSRDADGGDHVTLLSETSDLHSIFTDGT